MRTRVAVFTVSVFSLLLLSLGMGAGATEVSIEREGRERVSLIVSEAYIEVSFNNSVTGGRVEILYRVYRGVVEAVVFYTDTGTIEYYTSGLIEDLNKSARQYLYREVSLCSVYGIDVVVRTLYTVVYRGHIERECLYLATRELDLFSR